MRISETTLSALQLLLSDPATPFGVAPLFFVGDVGGTSARLGFALAQSAAIEVHYIKFAMANKNIRDLLEFFSEIQLVVGQSVTDRIVAAALSVCGPVTGGCVGGPFGNLAGVARLDEYPTALFPPGRSVLINDLEAGALGVRATSACGVYADYFTVMWEGSVWQPAMLGTEGEGKALPPTATMGKGNCLIVAPGTGLGSALIQYNSVTQTYSIVPLELGHTSVQCHTDLDYQRRTSEELGRGEYPPEYEDMVSGSALERHYTHALSDHGGDPSRQRVRLSAAEISELAIQGDPVARKAFDVFHHYLMRMCSQACMLFVPLTILLVGDNIVKNASLYDDRTWMREMQRIVEDHSMERLGYMSRVTFLRQTRFLDLNIVGCVGSCYSWSS